MLRVTIIFQACRIYFIFIFKLIQLMENYKDNRKVAELLVELKNIKVIFDELIEIEGKSQLTEESFSLIEKKIYALRKVVVDTP